MDLWLAAQSQAEIYRKISGWCVGLGWPIQVSTIHSDTSHCSVPGSLYLGAACQCKACLRSSQTGLAMGGPERSPRDTAVILLESSADDASLSESSLWRAGGMARTLSEGTGGSEGTGVSATSTYSGGLEVPRDWRKCDQRGRRQAS